MLSRQSTHWFVHFPSFDFLLVRTRASDWRHGMYRTAVKWLRFTWILHAQVSQLQIIRNSTFMYKTIELTVSLSIIIIIIFVSICFASNVACNHRLGLRLGNGHGLSSASLRYCLRAFPTETEWTQIKIDKPLNVKSTWFGDPSIPTTPVAQVLARTK